MNSCSHARTTSLCIIKNEKFNQRANSNDMKFTKIWQLVQKANARTHTHTHYAHYQIKTICYNGTYSVAATVISEIALFSYLA